MDYTLTLTPNFHTVGITFAIEGSTAGVNQTRDLSFEYSVDGSSFVEGFPLKRVGDFIWVGSIFWLPPGTECRVRVTLEPLGGEFALQQATNTVQTRAFATTQSVRTRFVAPDGQGAIYDRSQPGSLEAAVASAEPGDEILCLPGVYYTGQMALGTAATAAQPVTIRAQAQGEVIFDGADRGSANYQWDAQGNGVFRTQVAPGTADTSLVMVDGERIFPYPSFSAVQALSPYRISGFFANGRELNVHLANNDNPQQHQLVISAQPHCFHITGRHIFIDGIIFQHYARGAWPRAIYLDNGRDVTVRNCTFRYSDKAVFVRGTAHRFTFEDNECYDALDQLTWDAIKSGTYMEAASSLLIANTAPGPRQVVVRNNHFHDLFDGAALNLGRGVLAEGTCDWDFYGNVIERIRDDALEVDEYASNVRIFDNLIAQAHIAFSLARAHTGPVFVLRNLVRNLGVLSDSTADNTSSGFKFNANKPNPVGLLFVFHNTVHANLSKPDSTNNAFYTPSGIDFDGADLRNNILYGWDFSVRHASSVRTFLDYNCHHSETENLIQWGGQRYQTLEAFRQATNFEEAGLSGDPGFRNPSNDEYALGDESQCIGAAQIIHGINNLWSAEPDIGYAQTPKHSGYVRAIRAIRTGVQTGLRV